MYAIAVALESGKRFDRWTIEFCTPGPAKAIRHMPGTNRGLVDRDDIPNKKQPTAIVVIDTNEHTRGPKTSRIMPKKIGPT